MHRDDLQEYCPDRYNELLLSGNLWTYLANLDEQAQNRDVYKRQVNALAAADNVIIPVQAAYLPAKGLEQLLQTINKVCLLYTSYPHRI